MFAYQKLDVWQIAKRFIIKVYKTTDKFPSSERYGLISQITRAAVSIASNLAEGNSRSSNKERVHFAEIAYGSLMEVACQLEISSELGFLEKKVWEELCVDIQALDKNITALRRYYKKNRQ